jgi:hypothetical protein
MRAYRQLYAASRLLRHSIALGRVLELMDAARLDVEAAIDSPAATVATTADELRDVRANAIAQGGTPSVPTLPRNAISNILRGRIEELTGLALLGQGKTAEAVAALRRAVSVLPEKSLYWRMAQWRLGTALASSSGQERDALAAYIKSYNPQSPDPARRNLRRLRPAALRRNRPSPLRRPTQQPRRRPSLQHRSQSLPRRQFNRTRTLKQARPQKRSKCGSVRTDARLC